MHLNITKILLLLLVFSAGTQSIGQCEGVSDTYPFLHGVASGDATESAVIIWTRITPVFEIENIEVKWTISSDEKMDEIYAGGDFTTNSSRDYTVKVDVGQLEPDTWYYFAFEAMGIRSMIGRTHTLPVVSEHFAFAAFSCSNYERGYFNAYHEAMIRNNIQAVVHLGDYYYEYTSGIGVDGRTYDPANTLYTLEDYRGRHKQLCGDKDLQDLRRQFPWYVIWDDHEFANDCWTNGAPSQDLGISTWEERKAASKRAYFEWMPIRENADGTIHRSFSVGNLAQLNFVDTRMEGRSEQVAASSALINDSSRSILGLEQLTWLKQSLLENTTAKWNIVLSSVMMAPAVNDLDEPIDVDLWEGYRYERNELLRFISEEGIANFLSFAGDYHSSWASNLPLENYNEANHEGSVGVEIEVCATTSAPHTVGDIAAFMMKNPHVQLIEQEHNGFLLCEIREEEVRAQWKYVDTNNSRNYVVLNGRMIGISNGNSFLNVLSGNLFPDMNTASLLPVDHESYSQDMLSGENSLDKLELNPYSGSGNLEFTWFGPCGTVEWQIYNSIGQLVDSSSFGGTIAGYHFLEVRAEKLDSGMYFIHIRNGNEECVKAFFSVR